MSDSVNIALQQRNDEIDLIEIICVLWDKKWWIILTTFITTLLAGIYAFTAKEQWTSKATVIAPKVVDIGNYLSLRSEYANIIGVKDFSSQTVVNNLFDSFKTALLSNDVKKEFLAQSKWFEQYASKNADTDEQKQKLVSTILEKSLAVTIPDLKKTPNALGINVSFSAETAIEAQNVLEEYISFVNLSVLKKEKNDFLADINIATNDLELQKDRLQRDTESIRKVQLENLSTALDIAKSAEIKEYSKTAGNISIPHVSLGDAQIPFTDSKLSDGTYLFMLGEKYLKAQLDILSKNNIVYPVSFYTIEKQIALLTNLVNKVDQANSKNSYNYLASPDYPVNKDKPKKAIILIIGMMLGVILSSVVVIVSALFKKGNK